MSISHSEELKQLHSFINDFWAYQKAFYNVLDDDEYWDKLNDHGVALREKYRGCKDENFEFIKKSIDLYALSREQSYKNGHDNKTTGTHC